MNELEVMLKLLLKTHCEKGLLKNSNNEIISPEQLKNVLYQPLLNKVSLVVQTIEQGQELVVELEKVKPELPYRNDQKPELPDRNFNQKPELPKRNQEKELPSPIVTNIQLITKDQVLNNTPNSINQQEALPKKPKRSMTAESVPLQKLSEQELEKMTLIRQNQYMKRKNYLDLTLLSDEQFNIAIYEVLLYISLNMEEEMQIINEIIRPNLGISQKKHSSLLNIIKQLQLQPHLSPLHLRIQILKNCYKLKQIDSQDFLVWKNRQLLIILNLFKSEHNFQGIQDLEHFETCVQENLLTVELSNMIQHMETFLQKQKTDFNLSTWNLFQCQFYQKSLTICLSCEDQENVLDILEERFCKSLGKSPRKDVYYILQKSWIWLSEAFTLPSDTNQDLLRLLFHNINLLCVFYSTKMLRKYLGPFIEKEFKQSLEWMQKVSKPGLDILFSQIYSEMKIKIERYFFEYSIFLDMAEFETDFKLFIYLNIFYTDLNFQSLLPLQFPLTSNSLLLKNISAVFRSSLELQVLYNHHQMSQKSKDDTNKDDEQFLKNLEEFFRFDFIKQHHENFSLVFQKFINKEFIYEQIMEPRLKTFHAQVLHVVQSTNSSTLFYNLSAITDINQQLHQMNQEIHQISQFYSVKKPIYFDLNEIAEKSLLKWIHDFIELKMIEIVKRCIESDFGQEEDPAFGISSAPSDLFAYFYSTLDIFFSLPFNIKNEQNLAGCTLPEKYWKQVSNGICKAITLFAELSFKHDRDETEEEYYFKTFLKKKKHQKMNSSGGSSHNEPLLKEDPGKNIRFILDGTLKYFRRVNNLIYADYLTTQYLENKIINQLLKRKVSETTIEKEVREVFKSVHIKLNQNLIQLMKYIANRLVYFDLRKDFILNLYNKDPVEKFSLQTIQPILLGLIEEIYGMIICDWKLLTNKPLPSPISPSSPVKLTSAVKRTEKVAYLQLILFFKVFLEAYEFIVLMDPQSGRLFNQKHLQLLFRDLDLIESTFTKKVADFEAVKMLPKEGVSICLKPLRYVFEKLGPMETKELIHLFEQLLKQEKQKSEQHLNISHKEITSSELSLEEIFIQNLKDLSIQEETGNEYKKLHSLNHDWQKLFSLNASQKQQPLLLNTNPFLSDDDFKPRPISKDQRDNNENVWKSYLIFNILAKRCGYGHPQFNQFILPDSNFISSVLHKQSSSSDMPTMAEKPSIQMENVDKSAYLFIKKYGMKRWFEKRVEKAESSFSHRFSISSISSHKE